MYINSTKPLLLNYIYPRLYTLYICTYIHYSVMLKAIWPLVSMFWSRSSKYKTLKQRGRHCLCKARQCRATRAAYRQNKAGYWGNPNWNRLTFACLVVPVLRNTSAASDVSPLLTAIASDSQVAISHLLRTEYTGKRCRHNCSRQVNDSS